MELCRAHTSSLASRVSQGLEDCSHSSCSWRCVCAQTCAYPEVDTLASKLRVGLACGDLLCHSSCSCNILVIFIMVFTFSILLAFVTFAAMAVINWNLHILTCSQHSLAQICRFSWRFWLPDTTGDSPGYLSAVLGLHPGDLHVATPELTICPLCRLLGLSGFDCVFQ